jgi:hypothetical protein
MDVDNSAPLVSDLESEENADIFEVCQFNMTLELCAHLPSHLRPPFIFLMTAYPNQFT